MPFYPGPGIGGHCIPSDPMYLAWKVRVHGFEARFIELATHINGTMPEYVVERVATVLNERRKALKGARVLLLGLAYKKDVSDLRDSPAFDVARVLEERGAIVNYHDPFVPSTAVNGRLRKSVPLTPSTLRRSDCVVLLTNHTTVDYALVLRHAPVVVDTRNQFGAMRSPKLVRL
jgi:nucleotide sugar dehydrogenase